MRGLCHTLNDAFARQETAFARQTRFTADASHELRTPLSIIRTHIDLALKRERTPEEYREALQTCLRSAERMSSVVQGLLTLARADSGADTFARDEIRLDSVVRAVVESLQAAADERQIALHLDLAPVVVWGDGDRLADVASNLVSNAVRYNRPGGQVTVTLLDEAGDAELRVADTGIGIPAPARARIFERFYRVDDARSRAAGGAGLGLAITRWIVEGHGGTITVEDRPGGGSLFVVTLPGDGRRI
jgi:signal transduction histidine kinase